MNLIFNLGPIMQYIVTYAAGMYSWLSNIIVRYEFLIFDNYHPDTPTFTTGVM